MEKVLNMWRIRNLTLEGKILVFKPLALSKLIFLAQALPISKVVISALEKNSKTVYLEGSPSKNLT